ncbi:MAG: hypothetical protein ACI82I_003410, partial [Gammaproteobacteria bacterium]
NMFWQLGHSISDSPSDPRSPNSSAAEKFGTGTVTFVETLSPQCGQVNQTVDSKT